MGKTVNVAPMAAAILLLATLAGCGKPPIPVQKYILEYPSPVLKSRTEIPENLTVERFAVAQAFNTADMVYIPGPYKASTYNYSRWRVNPGDMVTDYLARDFRAARVFRGVFVSPNDASSHYRLEGLVEEFVELDEADGWKAALTVNVTLLDALQEEVPKRVMFQKKYRGIGLMPTRNPQGLAQGMSQAMEGVSARIINDVYQACQRRERIPVKER